LDASLVPAKGGSDISRERRERPDLDERTSVDAQRAISGGGTRRHHNKRKTSQ
jgi:hypothetical protein